MMAKIQRFGGAMFTPVLFFIFSGIVVALASVLNNPDIIGALANEGTSWNKVWQIIESGGWTVFNNVEILFAIGLPLGLANKAKGRAALESFLLYMTFNSFVSKMIELYPGMGLDPATDIGQGLKSIGGIVTLDTGVLGAIVVAAVVVWIHNRYFEKKLPEYLGVFQGSAFVGIIGFFAMLLLAILFSLVWPPIQRSVVSLQHFMVKSGNFGVFTFIFLEKALLPTGLHHFIYAPFQFGNAVVPEGTQVYWFEHLSEFAASTTPLKTLFPGGGFALQGLSNLFGIPGIALAFYMTAKEENKKKLLPLIVPGVLTAVLAGITEPFDYTFLFVAPQLFLVHALLAASFATLQYACGVVGHMGGGLIEIVMTNIVPMWKNHRSLYLRFFLIGALSIASYYFIFKFLIEKFDLPTPGRGDMAVKLYSKKEYQAKEKATAGIQPEQTEYAIKAQGFLQAFGGAENIASINNCATRLRIEVKDEKQVEGNEAFKEFGAMGCVRNGKAFQVIVDLDAPQIREEFEQAYASQLKSE